MQLDVAIVGAGPTGLAAALELSRRGVKRIAVLEREERAGGVPRHCRHTGFGARDLGRVLSGPRYAERYRERTLAAGIHLLERTQATGWTPAGALELTSPAGRDTIAAAAVLIATGCRERPRAARLVAGARPQGVLTTGELQQRVHLHGARLAGDDALVVGAEHVSFSAVHTLHAAGARTLALATALPRHQSLFLFRAGARIRYNTPIWANTVVSAIVGAERLEAVELLDVANPSAARVVPCQTVVFSADWVPDAELLRAAGCELDAGSKGPLVTADGGTTVAGLWAAGNVVHPAETAGVAALGGRHAAAAIAAWLQEGGAHEQRPHARIEVRPPLRWIAPGLAGEPVAFGPPARGRLLLRSDAFRRLPVLTVRQDGRELYRRRLPRLVPGRSASVPARWLRDVDPRAGAIEVAVE